jgi:hypothetical protein
MILVLGYIIGFQIFVEKRYLELDIPSGTIRASLKRGPKTVSTNVTQFPYCSFPGNNYKWALPCLFWDETEAVFPVTEAAAMLATTRVNLTHYELRCSQFNPNCTYTKVDTGTYYIGDIERFTLMVDHSMFTPRLNIQKNSRSLTGRLLDSNGDEVQSNLSPPNQFGQSGKYDILELAKVMELAGANMETEINGDPVRYSGTILLFFIDYDNIFTYNTNNVRYSVRVSQLKDAEFKSVEQLHYNSSSKQERNRHGIRIVFLPVGQIGQFQVQALILTLVSGAALMAVATVVTDIIATTFLPEKKKYEVAKYQDTTVEEPLSDVVPTNPAEQSLIA